MSILIDSVPAAAARSFRSLPQFVRAASPGQRYLDVRELVEGRRVWTYIARERTGPGQLIVDAIVTETQGRRRGGIGYVSTAWTASLALEEGRSQVWLRDVTLPCVPLGGSAPTAWHSPRRLRHAHQQALASFARVDIPRR